MPATLGHIGAQYLLSKLCFPRVDAKWVLAGCVIPDLPWIYQRIIGAASLVPATDMRLYVVAQSSMVLCLTFCGFVACFARNPLRVFAVLSFGAVLHFLLDAMQTKWANGVLFIAPLNWEPLNFGLFWPDDWQTYALYGLTLGTAMWILWRERANGADLVVPHGGRAVSAALLLGLYFLLPLTMMQSAFEANVHATQTLADTANRAGRTLEIDRDRILSVDDTKVIRTWAGEDIPVTGVDARDGALVSLKGQFVTSSTLRVDEVHLHRSGVRDTASYVSLIAIFVWWILSVMRGIREG